ELAAPLKELLSGSVLRAGHARSAGYGALRVESVSQEPMEEAVSVGAGGHTLYLASDYFAATSWAKPEEALLAELDTALGVEKFDGFFARPVRLEGFHGLWQLPRSTRAGLAAGSVFRFTAKRAGSLPVRLGGWLEEGCGRVICDPAFLGRAVFEPVLPAAQASPSEKRAKAGTMHPVLALWRRRTLDRLADEQAENAVWHEGAAVWNRFFDLLKSGGPSQSQRGNIRRLVETEVPENWQAVFERMLVNKSGDQWKNTVVSSPFAGDRYRDSLDKIMLALLSAEGAEGLFAGQNFWTLPEPVGGPLAADEEKSFRARRHKRLVLELLKRWVRVVRQGEAD
ncbi:MAG: hypothetical protein Q4F72_10395, partial [Desulfovibrionaceae bacterium]|nr:hypothetical protein [Desulfovibrionaceae bacterium]